MLAQKLDSMVKSLRGGCMRKYDILLFDLDGTLTEPREGITKAVQYALKCAGIVENNLNKLEAFIGPPLIEGFMQLYGFTEEEALEARSKYREYYTAKGALENEVYEGMEDLLKNVEKLGKTMLVATSKPLYYANIILEHFGIAKYFKGIFGAEMNEIDHKKSDVIKRAIEFAGDKELTKYLMIGDRKHDVIGAKTLGIDSIAVLYGYGSKEEFEEYKPNYIVSTVSELEKFLLAH